MSVPPECHIAHVDNLAGIVASAATGRPQHCGGESVATAGAKSARGVHRCHERHGYPGLDSR